MHVHMHMYATLTASHARACRSLQLRAPKPRIPVQHIWESETLKGRASLWKDVAPRPQPNNMLEMTRSKLGMSVPSHETGEMRRSRSTMIAARRTRDSLDAMQRERAADAASTETGFKSAASLFTPADLQKLRPIYAPNEKCATETTGAVIGLGAKKVPLQMSRFARQRSFPPDFTTCRNCPDKGLVDEGRATLNARPKPWQKQTLPDPMATSNSAFCLRPGDTPIR